MNTRIVATRAVTAEFFSQLIRPFLFWGIVIAVLLLNIIGFLSFFISPWFWLLTVPIVIFTTVVTVIWLIVRFILSRLSPQLTPEQKQATVQLVKKSKEVTETLQTPYVILIFYVIKDVILRREPGFIQNLIDSTKSLRPDFEKLCKLF